MQFISQERLKIKAAYYKAMETVMYPGRMSAIELNNKYDWTLQEENASYADIPKSWIDKHVQDGHMTHLDLQRKPWQYEALLNIIDRYGIGAFVGIDMHGIV